METTKQELQCLCKAIEKAAGISMRSHKDFVFLSEDISAKVHESIGVNTLKRIFGIIESTGYPRPSTLDILAQYVGAESFDAFRNNPELPAKEGDSSPIVEEHQNVDEVCAEERKPDGKPLKFLSVTAVILLVALVVSGGLYVHSIQNRMDILQDSLSHVLKNQYVLTRGQTFSSYDDYLSLFGVTVSDAYPYYQIHPHHPWLVLWGPEYHHPHWLNDGDSAQMMPTITERWAPADTLPELIAMRNSKLFYNGRRHNDIRLAFMKGLTSDTLFTFIGVYRFSLPQSDTTHIVWERVADRCNLNELELLEHLRN